MTQSLKSIGEKRQKKWMETNLYKVVEDPKKEKFYILDMFPYPSGAGLHVGHPKGYIASDVLARKKMLEQFCVLHPMGFDTFGLGTETYAIENKMKPQIVAEKNISTYIKQLEMFGCTYDWERSFSTADPEYYKRTQRVFLQFYNHYYDTKEKKAKPISELEKQLKKEGKSKEEIISIIDNQRLAYIDFKPINWCPKCKTGLANEDLDDGKCERCGSDVEQKPMKQWVLRITAYAERLIDGLDQLDRDQSMKELERNWIGKSEGTQFIMKVPHGSTEYQFEIYTTRIDTVFGMSFVAIAPEHPLVGAITTSECEKKVREYIEKSKYKTQLERTELQKEKTGEFTGTYAINPFNGSKVPIFVADYVLANYGTGVVMAVPAHDERDFDFAKKYDLPISVSILPKDKKIEHYQDFVQGNMCYPEKGIVTNSASFSGMDSDQAIFAMQSWLQDKQLGGKRLQYKIQDWVFSRQRYWGEPFPIILCEHCGIVPLKESDLPLLLPDVEHYEPTGTEEGPLADVDEWVNVKCPICGKPAKRETNTMPGWAGSSRYWLRYMDPKNSKSLVSPEREVYWKTVDVYVGGAEHVTRHMIYARFWQKFLFDIGVVTHEEPFQRYEKVGLIMAEDGRKMSKRWNNVVLPDAIVNEYGADTLRVYEMFMGPFDQAISWSTNGIKGVKKFLDKIILASDKLVDKESPNTTLTLLHQTIKKLTEDIDQFKFNTAIAQLMIFVNHLSDLSEVSRDVFEKLVVLIAPFAPHVAEELREKLGNEYSIFTKSTWPSYDEKYLVSDQVNLAVQVNGKMRGLFVVDKNASQDEVLNLVKVDPKVSGYLTGEIKKVIYVPGKILSIIC